jgi:hypothetical protein
MKSEKYKSKNKVPASVVINGFQFFIFHFSFFIATAPLLLKLQAHQHHLIPADQGRSPVTALFAG